MRNVQILSFFAGDPFWKTSVIIPIKWSSSLIIWVVILAAAVAVVIVAAAAHNVCVEKSLV